MDRVLPRPAHRELVVELLDARIVAIMQRKSPQQRLAQTLSLIDDARRLMHIAVQSSHPGHVESQVRAEVARRLRHAG